MAGCCSLFWRKLHSLLHLPIHRLCTFYWRCHLAFVCVFVCCLSNYVTGDFAGRWSGPAGRDTGGCPTPSWMGETWKMVAEVGSRQPRYVQTTSQLSECVDFTCYLCFWLFVVACESSDSFLDQELIPYRYSSCYYSSCWGNSLQKSLRHRHFKLDQDEIWQDCFSSKYVLIDGVGFLVWRYTFKMAAMSSFHEKA